MRLVKFSPTFFILSVTLHTVIAARPCVTIIMVEIMIVVIYCYSVSVGRILFQCLKGLYMGIGNGAGGSWSQVFVVITVKGLVSMRKVGLFICPYMEASRMSRLFLQIHFSVTLQVSNYIWLYVLVLHCFSILCYYLCLMFDVYSV